jgi:hypothetical protein
VEGEGGVGLGEEFDPFCLCVSLAPSRSMYCGGCCVVVGDVCLITKLSLTSPENGN